MTQRNQDELKQYLQEIPVEYRWSDDEQNPGYRVLVDLPPGYTVESVQHAHDVLFGPDGDWADQSAIFAYWVMSQEQRTWMQAHRDDEGEVANLIMEACLFSRATPIVTVPESMFQGLVGQMTARDDMELRRALMSTMPLGGFMISLVRDESPLFGLVGGAEMGASHLDTCLFCTPPHRCLEDVPDGDDTDVLRRIGHNPKDEE